MDFIYDHCQLFTYICCIILVIGFYIGWLSLYSFENQYTMACMLCILGIMYASALLLLTSKNKNSALSASCIVFLSMAFAIAVAASSNFKKADGSKDNTFVWMGTLPLVSGIIFSFCAVSMGAYAYATGSGGITDSDD